MAFLNIDLGELPDESEALYALCHVANVACGGHAGDDASMRRAVSLCLASGAAIGAHPSYPDRPNFGRKPLAMPPHALRASVHAQCAGLASVAARLGGHVAYLKAHGALYHAAAADRAVAEALLSGATRALGSDVTVVGQAAGALSMAAASMQSLRYAREGFADRGTRPNGTLVPRGEPGALVTDPQVAARLARWLAAGGQVETVCVHGDTPGAVAIASAVRRALDEG